MQQAPAPKTTSSSSEGGFTLVELMVAMGLVLISLFGLLEAATIATSNNMKNLLRDEAVLVGEDQMSALLRLPQASLPAFDTISTVSRTRASSKKFVVTRSSSPVTGSSSYKLVVNVGWSYKGVPYNHEVQSMRTYVDGQ